MAQAFLTECRQSQASHDLTRASLDLTVWYLCLEGVFSGCLNCYGRYKLAGSWSYEDFREHSMAAYLKLHAPFADEVKVSNAMGMKKDYRP